jgi:hypothetical protein
MFYWLKQKSYFKGANPSTKYFKTKCQLSKFLLPICPSMRVGDFVGNKLPCALRHEGILGSGCIDPHFLDLGTGGEWSASLPGRFTPWERAPGTRWIGDWWAPELVWTTWRRENSWPYRNLNSEPSVVQSVASRYTFYAIPATLLMSWYIASRLSRFSLCLTNEALRHEDVWGSRCTDPPFLDLGTSWRWVVSFTLRSLYQRGKSPRYPLDRRQGGPKSLSGWHGEMEILDLIGTRTPTPRSSSP